MLDNIGTSNTTVLIIQVSLFSRFTFKVYLQWVWAADYTSFHPIKQTNVSYHIGQLCIRWSWRVIFSVSRLTKLQCSLYKRTSKGNPGSFEHEIPSKRKLIPNTFRANQYFNNEVWTKVTPFLKPTHICVIINHHMQQFLLAWTMKRLVNHQPLSPLGNCCWSPAGSFCSLTTTSSFEDAAPTAKIECEWYIDRIS